VHNNSNNNNFYILYPNWLSSHRNCSLLKLPSISRLSMMDKIKINILSQYDKLLKDGNGTVGLASYANPPKSKCWDLKSRLRYSANIDRHSVESNILIKRTKLPNVNRDTAAHWSDIFVPIMNCHSEKIRFFKFGTNFI
jgi:hypothetical protein